MTLTGNTDDDAAAPANVYDPTNEPTESPTEEGIVTTIQIKCNIFKT